MSVFAPRSHAPQHAGLDVGGRGLVELVLSVAASLTFVVGWHVIGLVPVSFVLLLATVVLGAMASPRAFAVLVLILAPLPSLGAIFGFAIPLGLDPLNLLVLTGLGIAAQRMAPWPLAGYRALSWLVLLNFGLLIVAWYRTYGHEAIEGTSIALLAKPLIVVAAGIAVAQLLPRETRLRTLGAGMAFALFVVGLSVILQRLGLYEVYNQEARTTKQFGGLMLSGNSAGILFSTFAVPTVVILRSTGRARLGVALLGFTVPVLLITLSRGSMIAFLASLVFLAALERRRMSGVRIALVVCVFAAFWSATGGRRQFDFIWATYERTRDDANATLSGRPAIWDQALQFLDQGNHWVVGGGLDAFATVGIGGSDNYTTHSLYFDLLTTGGIIALSSFLLLIVAMWRFAGRGDHAVGTALRIALLSALVSGLAADFDFFWRGATWIWILVAATGASALERHARSAPAVELLAGANVTRVRR